MSLIPAAVKGYELLKGGVGYLKEAVREIPGAYFVGASIRIKLPGGKDVPIHSERARSFFNQMEWYKRPKNAEEMKMKAVIFFAERWNKGVSRLTNVFRPRKIEEEGIEQPRMQIGDDDETLEPPNLEIGI